MAWLDSFFAGYTTISINGVPLPAEGIINFTGSVTATDSSSTGATNVGIGSGTGLTVVEVSGPVTYTSGQVVVDTIYDCTLTGGAVTFTLPTGWTVGQVFGVKVRTSPASNNITINAPGGGTIEVPQGLAGAGTYVSTITLALAPELGSGWQWYCDGANNFVLFPN